MNILDQNRGNGSLKKKLEKGNKTISFLQTNSNVKRQNFCTYDRTNIGLADRLG
jgi:hypothetical protein